MTTKVIKDSMQFNLLDISATQAYPVSARYTWFEVSDFMSTNDILPNLTISLLLCYEETENVAIDGDKTKLIEFLVNPIYQPSFGWTLLPEIKYTVDGGTTTAIVYAKL